MNRRVLVILLDSLDAPTLEHFCGKGVTPTFSDILNRGHYKRLSSLENSLAECIHISIFSGHNPNEHGFHGQHSFDSSTYETKTDLLSGFRIKKPFYDLGNDIDVLTFDLPLCPLMTERPYTQIIDWGCHGFAVGGSSHPKEAWDDLINNIGIHPEHGIDYATLQSADSCYDLYKRQIDGLKMRTKATKYLMDKYPWELALTATSETHTGPHYLLKHPGNLSFYEKIGNTDPIEEIYKATDSYISELIKHAGPDTDVMMFSPEGMATNFAEVPNIALLPEMLFRYSFPGQECFDYDNLPPDLPDDTADEVKLNWVVNTARIAKQPNKIQMLLRKHLPEQVAIKLELITKQPTAPYTPESRPTMNYQPTVWMEPYWPYMKAFALPTFSDGFIRLNVKNRESKGIVKKKDFIKEANSICEALESYTSSMTGHKAIEKIVRTRDNADGHTDASPADLIVFWKDHDMGKLSSNAFGNIGPLPSLRAGVHTNTAFVMGCGPTISKYGLRDCGSITDIAPTVHALLKRPIDSDLPGKSLLADNSYDYAE